MLLENNQTLTIYTYIFEIAINPPIFITPLLDHHTSNKGHASSIDIARGPNGSGLIMHHPPNKMHRMMTLQRSSLTRFGFDHNDIASKYDIKTKAVQSKGTVDIDPQPHIQYFFRRRKINNQYEICKSF